VIRMIVTTMLVLLIGAFMSMSAAPDTIGIATARGGFSVDRTRVQGNATLFEGGVLETDSTPSVVRLQSGSEMQLGSTSRGRIYKDRLILEKGEGQIDKASGFRFEALGLRIIPDSSGTKARVALLGTERVAVAALAGTLRVTTAEGTLVARLEPGRSLEFEPQAAGAEAPFNVTGCVTAVGSRFVLKDATANVVLELRGQNLDQYAGQRVQIAAIELKGVQPGEGAAQVIQVTRITRMSGSCAVPLPAAKESSGGAEAGKTGSEVGTAKASRTPVEVLTSAGKAVGKAVATHAVIAGVAVAAVAGGVTLGLAGSDSESISR
jgi:hypothetical protein